MGPRNDDAAHGRRRGRKEKQRGSKKDEVGTLLNLDLRLVRNFGIFELDKACNKLSFTSTSWTWIHFIFLRLGNP